MMKRHGVAIYTGQDILTDGSNTKGILPCILDTEEFDIFDVGNASVGNDIRNSERIKGGYFLLKDGQYPGQEVMVFRGNTTDLPEGCVAHIFYHGWEDGEEKLCKTSLPLDKKSNDVIRSFVWIGTVWIKK